VVGLTGPLSYLMILEYVAVVYGMIGTSIFFSSSFFGILHASSILNILYIVTENEIVGRIRLSGYDGLLSWLVNRSL